MTYYKANSFINVNAWFDNRTKIDFRHQYKY